MLIPTRCIAALSGVAISLLADVDTTEHPNLTFLQNQNSIVQQANAIDIPSEASSPNPTPSLSSPLNFDVETNRLKACPADSNCVSSSYLEPPNRYISPLKTFRDKETAFTRAIQAFQENSSNLDATSASKGKGKAAPSTPATMSISLVDILPKSKYLHLTVPGTSPGSFDDVEILFGDEGIVNIRCQARVTLPPPPFCIEKNCINGSMDQRKRLDKVSQILGLPAADQERMQSSAKWTPIFFNSDKVPYFDDDF